MRALLLVPVSLLAACAVNQTHRVGEITARPNVALKKSSQSIGLKLSDGVKDAWVSPRENGVGPLEVTAWTTSLSAAFATAFADAFTIKNGDSDLVLDIQDAELKLVPGAVDANGYVVSGAAQVRFKAQLLDRTGKQVAVTAGTSKSKTTCSAMDCAPSVAISAVESMYEAIAQDLFVNPKT